VRSPIATGSSCIVGPSSAPAIEEINGMAPRQRRAALIYSTFAATPHVGSFVVDLPPSARPEATLTSKPRADHDPRAAFAALYESTDPPIGPAHTTDARQFDAIVLCYLGAVAAKTTDPRLARSISAPRPGWPRYSWQTLDDAILALQQGQVIQYVGVSGRFGVGPPGVT
jgi:hypothetical protein